MPYKFVLFLEPVAQTMLLYTCPADETESLIRRKMESARTPENPTGSHVPWVLYLDSIREFSTAGAARREAKMVMAAFEAEKVVASIVRLGPGVGPVGEYEKRLTVAQEELDKLLNAIHPM